jgi:hypothetical protein
MVRPLDACPSHIALCDLSYAERLALWSLRHLIRREPPRCCSLAAGMAWGCGDELHRISDAFRAAVDDLNRHTARRLRLDCQASLQLTSDEVLLLRCLAGLQQDRHSTTWLMGDRAPHPHTSALFLDAMQALAATLGACGYWLTDLDAMPRHAVAASPTNANNARVHAVFA